MELNNGGGWNDAEINAWAPTTGSRLLEDSRCLGRIAPFSIPLASFAFKMKRERKSIKSTQWYLQDASGNTRRPTNHYWIDVVRTQRSLNSEDEKDQISSLKPLKWRCPRVIALGLCNRLVRKLDNQLQNDKLSL